MFWGGISWDITMNNFSSPFLFVDNYSYIEYVYFSPFCFGLVLFRMGFIYLEMQAMFVQCSVIEKVVPSLALNSKLST